tara:strand:+ start:714 stop:824 length:111 start_codon:yes stop_codon:yes gene_type:complete
MKKNSNTFLKCYPEEKYKLKNLKVGEILKLKTTLTL